MASEYLKWKYRDVKPDAPVRRTRRQRAANWWHYHRWPLLVGAIVLAAAVDILCHALGVGTVKPDYQVACVTSAPLSEETLAAIRDALARRGADCDGDGRVTVSVNAYVDMAAAQDSDAARYAAAAKVRLMADMEACESYFFICDDSETFHNDYQLLAGPDGALTERWEDCLVVPLADVPAIQANPAEAAGLFLARRGFWGDRVCAYRDRCDALWDQLMKEAGA